MPCTIFGNQWHAALIWLVHSENISNLLLPCFMMSQLLVHNHNLLQTEAHFLLDACAIGRKVDLFSCWYNHTNPGLKWHKNFIDLSKKKGDKSENIAEDRPKNINLRVQLDNMMLRYGCQAKVNLISLSTSNQKRLCYVMNGDIYWIWEILQ